MVGYDKLGEETGAGHLDKARCEPSAGQLNKARRTDGEYCGCSYTVQGIVYLTAGVIVHIALGSVYTFGNISPYMISYLRNRTSETSVRNVDALWINIIASVSAGAGTTLGGVIDRRYGPRMATILGCLVYSSSTALTYFSVKKSIYLVGITYGFLANLGTTFVYGPTVQTAIKWYPARASLASGVILAGFGGGALIINTVVTGFINPDNLSPDLKASDGDKYFTNAALLDRVPYVFLLLGGIFFVLIMTGAIFIRNPPCSHSVTNLDIVVGDAQPSSTMSDNSLKQTNNVNISSLKPDVAKSKSPPDKSVLHVLKTFLTSKDAYVVWFMVVFFYGGMSYIINLYKAYGQTFISDDHFLSLVGSLSAVCNSIGRPVWGVIMDRFGYQVTTKLLISVWSCFTCTLLLTEHIGKGGFLLWSCVIFFCYCGIWPVSAATVSKLFGKENLSLNFGFIMLGTAVASTASGLSAISLRDVIGWHGIFLMAGIFGVIGFFTTFLFTGKDEEGNEI